MVNEADKFAEEDKKRREAVEAKNSAESLVYQTEKQLKEFADKVGLSILRGCWEGRAADVQSSGGFGGCCAARVRPS